MVPASRAPRRRPEGTTATHITLDPVYIFCLCACISAGVGRLARSDRQGGASRAMTDPIMDVILASHVPHLPVLVRNLRSWSRHVSDLELVRFDVVVGQSDRPLFAASLLHGDNACGLAMLQIKLFTIEHLMLHHAARVSEAAFNASRHTLLSTKKLLGCMSAISPLCFFVDSESMVIRRTSAAALLDAYLSQRAVLYNDRFIATSYWQCVAPTDDVVLSWDRAVDAHAHAHQTHARGETPPGRTPWYLESYHWIFNRTLVSDFASRLLFPRLSTLHSDPRLRVAGCPRESRESDEQCGGCPRLFFESTLYKYIASNASLRHAHTFVETSQIFRRLGFRSPSVANPNQLTGCSTGECLGMLLMKANRSAVSAVASLYRQYGLPGYTPRGSRFDVGRWHQFAQESGVAMLLSSDGFPQGAQLFELYDPDGAAALKTGGCLKAFGGTGLTRWA